MISQIGGGANVIEVAVREDDGVGRRAEMPLGPTTDIGCGKRQPGIDQGPCAVWMTDAEDIYEEHAQAVNPIGDGINRLNLFFWNFNAIH